MKKIIGLDLGTNSIGWALIQHDFDKKEGSIDGLGSRIIPMSQNMLTDFDKGVTISQTADRTRFRGTRRLYQRDTLRRERLHRVMNILGLLPEHYAASIDFEKHFGQFKDGKEIKLNYRPRVGQKDEFIFMDSFLEMVEEFNTAGHDGKMPYDLTIYYLRKKALTEKIGKEELAWLILNFNQKRGYYQLRGEDETDNTKLEEFHALKIVDVQVADDDSKGEEQWYNVILENDWVYKRKSKKPLNDWIGKTREFIVTTQLEEDGTAKKDKEGKIKRSFRSPKEDDWGLVKKKSEQGLDQFNEKHGVKGVATYIYDALLNDPKQKIRGKLVRTIERHYYKDELEQILSAQAGFHKDVFENRDLYKACVDELYPRNEAHQNNIKDKDLKYLFLKDIIFYHRPLKSKKSTISNCQYECRKYKDEKGEEHTQSLKGIPKSHPLFQEFRLWQFLKNLKFYQLERTENGRTTVDFDVTEEFLPDETAWLGLFDFMSGKKEVEQKNLIDHFVSEKVIDKTNKKNYRWNYVSDKKYPAFDTRAQFISRLSKIEGMDADAFLTLDVETSLWHLIYSVTDKKEFETALGTFAKKNKLDKEPFVEHFKKFPPFKSEYGSYSLKAIKKLLPLMRRGKHWVESEIDSVAKARINSIIGRLKTINFQVEKIDANLVDDDIPARLLKSFIPFKDTDPLQGLNTYQACYAVYNRHSEASEVIRWRSPQAITDYLDPKIKGGFRQHSLRNPIVEQVVTETLRVIRDIWQHYGNGKPDFFNEIHIELGREMKNDKKTRERLTEQNTKNENTNQRIKELLKELMNDSSIIGDVRSYSPSQQDLLKIYEEGIYQNPNADFSNLSEKDMLKIRGNSSPSQSEITRYKLWLGQGYVSPYTGEVISLSRLFTTDYQIEHIIPRSRNFDNSMSNKVICESAINALKDNQTGYEFIKNHGTSIIDLGDGKTAEVFTVEQYENHCNRYFKGNRGKLKKLLSEDVPEGFIERQLNDTRHISSLIKGLLSNIVREEGEQEATSKHIIPVVGSITSRLKNDWGLNDKWNELMVPRFKRLNEKTNSQKFGFWDEKINAFRIQVPDEISKGFSKKRIDHRHHALDALVVACVTKDHTNYITSLNTERNNHKLVSKLRKVKEVEWVNKQTGEMRKRKVAKAFHHPWNSFTTDAKHGLEKTIVSFKQNLRVINKTVNRYWSYKDENGKLRLDQKGKPTKGLTKQTKGDSWAIRKPLHTPLPYGKINVDFDVLSIADSLGKLELIIDETLRNKVRSIVASYTNLTIAGKEIKKKNREYKKVYGKYEKSVNDLERLNLKREPDQDEVNKLTEVINGFISELKNLENGLTIGHGLRLIEKTPFKTAGVKYRKRQPLSKLADRGQTGIKSSDAAIKFINKVSDRVIRKDLLKHLMVNNNDIDKAFSIAGLDTFNSKRAIPVYKLPISESSSLKFPLGLGKNTKVKYGEAEGGTNLYFTIYWNEDKEQREFDSTPLNEVIEHQKQTAHLPKTERTPVPIKVEKGVFMFTLSPNDLVYVPTNEEFETPNRVDFGNLNLEQMQRLFTVNNFSGSDCYFTPNSLAKAITKKEVDTSFDSKTANYRGLSIKNRCWKLTTDRLGNVKRTVA